MVVVLLRQPRSTSYSLVTYTFLASVSYPPPASCHHTCQLLASHHSLPVAGCCTILASCWPWHHRGLSEKERFSLKNALMGTGPSLYSQYVPKPSHLEQLMRNTFQQETALISHHSASNFWLNFTGSLVATIFVKSHTYCIYWQLLFVSNSITTLMWKDM